jgi:hypothetical protein
MQAKAKAKQEEIVVDVGLYDAQGVAKELSPSRQSSPSAHK